MEQTLFIQYKEIKDQLAALEAKKDELELALFDEFDHSGQSNCEVDGTMFFRMSRKTYEYSPAIQAQAVALSKAKKIEEINGVAALKKESQYIRVVTAKESK